MRFKNKNAAFFDDNFEVTYEEDIPLSHSDYPTQHKPKYDLTIDEYDEFEDEDTFEDEDDFEDSFEYDTEPERDTYSPRNTSSSTSSKKRRSRKKRRPTQLAAPIQKGGEAVFGIARSVIRNLSLLLMLAILIFMGYNFLRGSAPYGDIEHAISTNTYPQILAAYFSVAAILIFYEIISILWAMTKVRVRDKYGSHREDVGRGLTSFVLLYLLSYAAFFTNRWIPESVDILKGLKGALDVFGSMHNALFGLCLAGVISCLFRKHSITL